MAVVGGLRARLIRESLYQMVNDALTNMGWFDPARRHQPVTFNGRPYNADQEIPINTLVLSDERTRTDEQELGSMLGEHRWGFYLDFYAENDALGLQLIRDVKDLIEGRIASAGRTRPNFPVYDFRQATPPTLFYCDIEDAFIDRAVDFPKPYQRHWYACRFDVVDAYDNESD